MLEKRQQKFDDGELLTAKQGKLFEEITRKYYVHKDKIKRKIEEVKNGNENYTFKDLTSEDIRRTIVTNLAELLEE